jgi:flagellar basal body-associated protein FliL
MKKNSGTKRLVILMVLIGIFTPSHVLVAGGQKALDTAKKEATIAQEEKRVAQKEAEAARERERAAREEAEKNKTMALIFAIVIIPVALTGVGVGIHATRKAKEKKNAGTIK